MSAHLSNALLKTTLVTLLLITPPLSDAVEKKASILEKQEDGAIMRIVSDSWRKGTIEAAYLLNKNIESRAIEVAVVQHTAYIYGTVSSSVKKNLAEEIALSVEGIDKVVNQLSISPIKSPEPVNAPASTQDKNDLLLSAKINQRLLTNKHLIKADIEVHAENGVIELSGKTLSEPAKDLAYYLAKNTSGVKSVDNKLRVTERIN